MCGDVRALRGRATVAEALLARPERPSRCTFPITALRVMPPSSPAIWLADRPSDHNLFSNSTRSSVHDMLGPPRRAGQRLEQNRSAARRQENRPTYTQDRRSKKDCPPHEISYLTIKRL